MLLWLLSCGLPCELEVTGECEVTWSECAEDARISEVRLWCDPDPSEPGEVRCSCERDGQTRAVWPEPAEFCDDVQAARRGELEERAEEQCSL